MSGSFRELLSQNTDTAERPKAMPEGHYIGTIMNHEFGQSKNKQTPYVRFMLKPTEATSDVDADELQGIDLERRELRRDFFITPQALYRLGDFLDAVLGKETGRSFDERIPETRDVTVMFKVTKRTDEERNETFNDVTTIVRYAA